MGKFQLNKKGEDPLKIYEDVFKIANDTVETHLGKLGKMPKPISRENNLYKSPDGNWNESWQDEYWTHRLITAMRDNNGYEQIMDDIMEEMEADPNHADYFNKKLEYVKDAERSRPMHLFGIGESKASEGEFKCPKCKFETDDDDAWSYHMQDHDEGDSAVSDFMKYEMESKASEGMSECPHCDGEGSYEFRSYGKQTCNWCKGTGKLDEDQMDEFQQNEDKWSNIARMDNDTNLTTDSDIERWGESKANEWNSVEVIASEDKPSWATSTTTDDNGNTAWGGRRRDLELWPTDEDEARARAKWNPDNKCGMCGTAFDSVEELKKHAYSLGPHNPSDFP